MADPADRDAPADPPAPPARRRFRWTHILWVSVVAFGLWLLLDAPTLQDNAKAQPVGVRRTVSLDILGPIAAVSRGLGLSHVVSVADGAIGHTNQPGAGSVLKTVGPTGTTTTTAPARPGTRGATSTTTTAPGVLTPTAADPLRVLIIGDSIGLDLGGALQNDLAQTGVVSATLDGVIDTGLTRPDYYNWPAELQSDVTRLDPQVVVMMIGANDPQDFPGPPDVPYGSAQWNQIYAQRALAFAQLAASRGAKVVWVGMPPMQSPGLSVAMANLDAIDQEAVDRVPGAAFVSSWNVLGTPEGQYTAFKVVNGQEVNVRTPDGTHLAPGGSELLSQAVISYLRDDLHIALPG